MIPIGIILIPRINSKNSNKGIIPILRIIWKSLPGRHSLAILFLDFFELVES